MAEIIAAPVRGPGRPPLRSEAETRALIIAAAAQAFLDFGYVRTGVDSIAREVGISTRTLYRLFATKEDLLREAMEVRIDEAFGNIDIESLEMADGREGLTALLDSYAQLMLSDDAVRLTRLIAAERHEVPGLVESYRQAAARVAAIFDDWIGQQQRRGLLDAERSKHAADLLRGMINEAQRQILLGLRAPLTDGERRDWVAAAAALFLDGCAVRR